MATKQQYEQIISEINNKLEKITSYSIEELIRESELGTQFCFKEIEDYFVKTIDLFKRVKEVNLSEVPYNLLNTLNTQLKSAISYFDQAKRFNATENNAVNIRKSIISNITTQYDNYYLNSIPILSIDLLNSNDLSLERSKLKHLLEEVEREKENSKKKSEELISELKNTLENAKSFATNAGVSKHSDVFGREADFHEIEAAKWLKYTIWILIGIVLSSIILVFLGKYFEKNSEIVHFTISKIIILSALFYSLSISNRNYKAHKHNKIMNKHRQNALITFETFSAAASADEQTKNAVLLETTRAIFSNQQTGYLKSEGESDGGNKIVEIIKGVASKGN